MLHRYLQRYAEQDSGWYSDKIQCPRHPLARVFEWVLVIPVFDEAWQTLLGLKQQILAAAVAAGDPVAVVWVVNCPDSSDPDCIARNQILLAALISAQSECEYIIDRVSVPIANQQGVGLARKLGADFAVGLIADGRVRQPWILNTDADVQLPLTYFQQWRNALSELEQHSQSSPVVAMTHVFKHVAASYELESLAAAFDKSLHAYVQGLRLAGSPYDFYALGSIIGLNAQAYVQVRGFPKKSGGEDFYILNKLRKLGPVAEIRGEPICIAARLSARVPFGTGPSLKAALGAGEAISPTAFTPAFTDEFLYLKQLLSQVNQLSPQANWQALPVCLQPLFKEFGLLQTVLRELGFETWLQKLARQPRQAALAQKFHHWFDALKTWQFLKRMGS